ncbi:Uncharacterised protein [Mycobacteroides abscessus subsp. abscessus]|uniref:hypothetical protein n=1 Tax=Mycobacteroides abscessus TaxID=36809 RepID=UPI00092B05FD|nr:hypothetical protein [Mycobacteroides abscessus]SIM07275.1 Uncharacterised protein [Mycobacteroides abscessus subsp. abscessus]SIM83852.1 Uncharacterised protein [Mycobacteroides abscessus subsp. abscessus]
MSGGQAVGRQYGWLPLARRNFCIEAAKAEAEALARSDTELLSLVRECAASMAVLLESWEDFASHGLLSDSSGCAR